MLLARGAAELGLARNGSRHDASRQKCIAVKELVPIIIAAVIWGPEWKGQLVCAHCDKAVVDVLGSRSCKDKDLMQMLRSLFFLEATQRN